MMSMLRKKKLQPNSLLGQLDLSWRTKGFMESEKQRSDKEAFFFLSLYKEIYF